MSFRRGRLGVSGGFVSLLGFSLSYLDVAESGKFFLQLFSMNAMINSIKFSNINKISFKGGIKNEEEIPSLNSDRFEKSTEAKYIETLENARKEVLETLHKDGVEKAIIISANGEILDAIIGDDDQVSIDANKCVPNSTLIHGHPDELALSRADVELLFKAKMGSMIAITPSGKMSSLKNSTPPRYVNDTIFEEVKCEYAGKIMRDLNICYDDEAHQLAFLYSDFAHNLNTTQRSAKLNNETLKEFAQKMGLEYQCDIFDEELAPKEDFVKWAKETEFTRTLLKESLSDFSEFGELNGKKYFGIIGNKNFMLRINADTDFTQGFENYEIMPVFDNPECVAIIQKQNSNEPEIEVINSNNYKENFGTHYLQVQNFVSEKNLYAGKKVADYYFNYD